MAVKGGRNQKICWGDFIPGGENMRSDFDDSNLLQS